MPPPSPSLSTPLHNNTPPSPSLPPLPVPREVDRDSGMGDERQAFYVVRKGDVVAIYRTLSDCQAQAGCSPSDPSITVYKGHCLSKDAEAYLASRGLKNASFSVAASDLQDGLFGPLAICPFQDASSSTSSSSNSSKKQPISGISPQSQALLVPSKNFADHATLVAAREMIAKHVNPGSNLDAVNFLNRNLKFEGHVQPQNLAWTGRPSCVIEFDGASKGNPGPAGAGAVVRADDGSVVWLLREGVGIATNNVAEYRGVILGLKYALKGGYKHVHVRGDSQLVCKQVRVLVEAISLTFPFHIDF